MNIKKICSKFDNKYADNLFNNLLFTISCVIFNLVATDIENVGLPYSVEICIGLSSIMAVIYAMRNSSFYKYFKDTKTANKIFSLFATIGIIMFYLLRFNEKIETDISEGVLKYDIEAYLPFIYLLLGIAMFPFAVIMFSKLYNYLGIIFCKLYKESTKIEKIVCVVTFVTLFIFMIIAFNRATPLYSSQRKADIVYTSDSPMLLSSNVWLYTFNLQNDIRQPLFAIFSAPFVAPLYGAIGWLEGISTIIVPLIIATTNSFLLVIIAYMLATLVENKNKRMLFFIFYISTFSPLLFNIVMEQYVTAVFWIVTLIYMNINDINNRKISFVGATGSLLTSGVLFPLICNAKDGILKKIKDLIKAFFYTFFVMFIFSRLDILMVLKWNINSLTQFIGDKISFAEKFIQYTNFIPNCFVAINDGPINNAWKTLNLDQYNIVGIIIISLCILSIILNKKDKLSQISFMWCIYSFIIICIIGWGTVENGLVLYSLYFGWAFIVLIYKLIKYIFDKLKLEKAFIIVIVLIAASFLIYNLYDLNNMITYLTTI